VVVVTWGVGRSHGDLGLSDRVDKLPLCRDVSSNPNGVCRRVANCREHPVMFDMDVIVRCQDQERCASITSMIRHYVAEGRR
jgi:hypothetical protein